MRAKDICSSIRTCYHKGNIMPKRKPYMADNMAGHEKLAQSLMPVVAAIPGVTAASKVFDRIYAIIVSGNATTFVIGYEGNLYDITVMDHE